MKKLIAAAALLAAFTGSAWSADMAVKARPIVAAPVFTWTGCFVGLNGGYVWAHKKWRDDNIDSRTNGQDFSHDPKGGMVGGQFGCDGQYQNWVFGFQVDGDWVDAKGSGDYLRAGLFTAESQVKALGTATGRFGYAFDKFLLYVRGGFAWERDEYRVLTGPGLDTNLPVGSVWATGNQNRFGYVVGVGGEYVFWTNLSNQQLSLFAEYNHFDFGRGDPLPLQNVRTGNTSFITSIRETKDVVKAGINFRFATGAVAAPVVAKY